MFRTPCILSQVTTETTDQTVDLAGAADITADTSLQCTATEAVEPTNIAGMLLQSVPARDPEVFRMQLQACKEALGDRCVKVLCGNCHKAFICGLCTGGSMWPMTSYRGNNFPMEKIQTLLVLPASVSMDAQFAVFRLEP